MEQEILDRLKWILEPLGWVVELLPPLDQWDRLVRFGFRLTVHRAGRVYEVGRTFSLSPYELRLGRPGFVDEIVLHAARSAVCGAVKELDTPIPPAPEPDWRPTEMIPEDYHS